MWCQVQLPGAVRFGNFVVVIFLERFLCLPVYPLFMYDNTNVVSGTAFTILIFIITIGKTVTTVGTWPTQQQLA